MWAINKLCVSYNSTVLLQDQRWIPIDARYIFCRPTIRATELTCAVINVETGEGVAPHEGVVPAEGMVPVEGVVPPEGAVPAEGVLPAEGSTRLLPTIAFGGCRCSDGLTKKSYQKLLRH